MAAIIQSGNSYRIASIDGTYDKLPVGVYNLECDDSGFFLTKTQDFKLPKKIYGDMTIVDRWLHTYQTREKNLGVLLAGLKGGGKTITAKLLAIKSGLPIITIQCPYSGPGFISFITNQCLGDCVIFLDEYEKVYNKETKNNDGDTSLLSVLDGPYQMHHLFIFTVNDTLINSNLNNRPSRIFYKKNYAGLSPEEIREVADDLVLNKDLVDDLVSTASRMFQISFDTLISIIEEMNRYDEPASQCILNMNLTPSKIYFDAWQFANDGDNGVKKMYAGDNVTLQYDDEGKPYFELKYNFKCKRETKDGGYNEGMDYIWMSVDFDDFKKTSSNTYEMCDGEVLFVLKERSFYDYGYAYSRNKTSLKPVNEVPNLLIQYKNLEGKYVYSENHKATIAILQESGYSDMSSKLDPRPNIGFEGDCEDCGKEYCAG